MNDKLTKPYDPAETEPRIYEKWQSSGYFNPDKLPERHRKPYTIIMPPPNANASLHAGHAVFVAIEDLLIRYHRMKGDKTLWLPGADHAGFETQVVYEKKLEKEGRSRFGMDPDKLRAEIMEFTLGKKSFMEGQMRHLGASCDWSREKFTLDPDIIKTVYATFQKLYDDGLVYRGKRSVNWCTKHQTSLSELETVATEQTDSLYYIKYGPFIVATVRPETIFGDVAIAVNPTDERYKKFINQEIEVQHPENTLKVKIIADDFVDPSFGTGAVKVTPAHDPNDFAMSQRHGLPVPVAIDQFGKLTDLCGKYKGMNINDARKQVVTDLQALGLMDHIDDRYVHAIKRCYKCERILEPRILPQWFVKIKPLAKPVIEAIERDEIVFYPEHYKKIMLHWLNNIEDWNVSRQIVWGIPIPAWYHEPKCVPKIGHEKEIIKCKEIIISTEKPICEFCDAEYIKETDTFDTWFSSGQWPFASLGYPDSKDFKEFYPTDVIETAGDIIFFWVARMLMFGMYRTGKLPFSTIYLHGLVTARDGKKMSKSKGNVINPLELTEKYGTDALRMGLIIGNTPGTPNALYEDKIKAYKHFANKIWNVSRFILSNIADFDHTEKTKLKEADEKNLAELKIVVDEVTTDIEGYKFYIAAEKVYHYFWHTFADKILEESKSRLNQTDNAEDCRSIQYTLLTILKTNLKLLHPFMPFITEELWSMMPKAPSDNNLLIIETWPH